MKRNVFLANLLTFLSTPLLLLSNEAKAGQENPVKGFKIGKGEGRKHGHIQLKGVNSNVLDVKISGSDTQGQLAVFEQTSLSQGRGTPLHVHPDQDEVFYVLEGDYYFQVGDEKFRLTVGESIFLPRKVPHAWTQVSAKGKMMVTLQPAGKLEDFFLTMRDLNHEPSAKELAGIFSKNDMQVLGPPLAVPK